jgi:hypothetical protein
MISWVDITYRTEGVGTLFCHVDDYFYFFCVPWTALVKYLEFGNDF